MSRSLRKQLLKIKYSFLLENIKAKVFKLTHANLFWYGTKHSDNIENTQKH